MKRFIFSALSLLLLMASCKEEGHGRPLKLRGGVLKETATLAIIRDTDVPGDIEGITSHTTHFKEPSGRSLTIKFSRLGGGVAYLARDNRGNFIVHNGRQGGTYEAIGDFEMNDTGERIAYGARKGRKWFLVIDGIEGQGFDEVGSPVFSPDGLHVACEVRKGRHWHILLDGKISSGCESYYDKPLFSHDSKRLLRVENTRDILLKRFVISDLSFSHEKVFELRGRLLVMGPDNRRVAFVEELPEGKRLVEIRLDSPEDLKKGALYDEISYVSFGEKGVAYAAIKGRQRYLIYNEREIRLPEGDLLSLPVIRPDEGAMGIFIGNGKKIRLYQFLLGQPVKVLKGREYESASDLIYSRDGKRFAHLIKSNGKIHVVVDGKRGSGYDMIVEPVFSPDGRYILFRARNSGKRFVVLADAENGKTIRESEAYEQVFPVIFTEDGGSFAYGVKDGNKLLWKVEDLKGPKSIKR